MDTKRSAPQDPPPALETVRVIEVANVAWPGLEPSIELVELEGGRRGLRFAAFQDGEPFAGPLVIEERALETLAAAIARAPRVKALLARMVEGVAPRD